MPIYLYMISKGREYLVTNELRRQKECLRLKDTKKHNKCDDQIQLIVSWIQKKKKKIKKGHLWNHWRNLNMDRM